MFQNGRSASAPFSFHCTICFELMNLTDRAPVVLPCGHTYLCEPCAKRLDKCMECRTPLCRVIKPAQHQQQQPLTQVDNNNSNAQPIRRRPSNPSTLRSSYRSHGGTGHQRHQNSPQKPVKKSETVPLPIPKNHVLMCLIETVQKSGSLQDDGSRDGYESGNDDELVLRGMKAMGSSSGTYVVREKGGLRVQTMKSNLKQDTSSTNFQDADTDHEGEMILKCGQTVQIQLFENRIATIARGKGYILVDSNSQLVKVGGVTDEACKLQAVEKAISAQILEMENVMKRLAKARDSVNSKLKKALEDSENADPFGPVPIDPSTSIGTSSPKDSKLPIITESQSFDERKVAALSSANVLEPSLSFENLRLYEQMYGSISKKKQANKAKVKPRNHENAVLSFFWPWAVGNGQQQWARSEAPPSPPTRQTDNTSINFASGLSGHRGLNRSNSARIPPPRRVRMMSHAHAGIPPIASKTTW